MKQNHSYRLFYAADEEKYDREIMYQLTSRIMNESGCYMNKRKNYETAVEFSPADGSDLLW